VANKVEIIAEPGSLEVTAIREFNATPEQLFKAHTDPTLLAKWFGPKGEELNVEEYDARHGGMWSYRTAPDAEGKSHGFHGVFHGPQTPTDGIQYTWEYEGTPGHVLLEHVGFKEIAPGRTVLRAHSVYQTVKARDKTIEIGMETGLIEAYQRLDELLASSAVTV
jgi:uncharacterized protein YndB with AHSA1/START domain